jgi:hypothetical protein
MPESFDAMLAELADAAAALTPVPDVAAVRRRAHERAVHRRMAASAFALILFGTCGGTLAVVDGQFSRPTQGTITPGATANVSTAATPPGGSAAFGGGAASLDPSEIAAYTQIAGTWESAGGGEYLVVFTDGGIGMSEKGAWQLCDGQLADVGADIFYVDELACGDYGTSGLMLIGSGSDELKLSVPALDGSSPRTVLYRRVAAPSTAGADEAVLQSMAGDWFSDGGRHRLVLGADGAVSLVTIGAGASVEVEYPGSVTGVYADGVRVEVSCGAAAEAGAAAAAAAGAAAPTGTECGVVELERIGPTRLYVVGSTGTELFTLGGKSAGNLLKPTGAGGTVQSTSSPASLTFTTFAAAS